MHLLRNLCLACFLLIFGSATAQSFYAGTGHYYELVLTSPVSWTRARNLAAARTFNGWPGHLATVSSSGEEAFLNGLGDLVFTWIDGTQAAGAAEPGGGWGWANEQPFTYTDWSQGEPNNNVTSHGTENRIAFCDASVAGSRQWMDLPEDGGFATIRGYVVEYEPPVYTRWQGILNPPPTYIGLALLLTDGTVLCAESDTSTWWRLTPDAFGSYVYGTWAAVGSLQSGYGPQYAATAVLPDGRVVILGGEYNLSSTTVWTNQGAIFDPISNTWSPLSPPAGWSSIGDAQCCVLPDGRFMVANPFNTRAAVLNPATLNWTEVGSGKADAYDEEGWVLMPDGTILSLDSTNVPHSEKYVISSSQWLSAGSTPQPLVDTSNDEMGPAVLLPNGKVLWTGATSHNAIYTPGPNPTDPGIWSSGPEWPVVNGQQTHIADGPACLMPNGNVLCCTSPGLFVAPDYFFEFDGTNMNLVPGPPRADVAHSSHGSMLMLPTGQILFTDYNTDVEVYNPSGTFQEAWRPTTSYSPSVVAAGQTFILRGTQLNGLSQCAGYGDDVQTSTNYPLVRITNLATGHVKYARTHDHSTMGVATGSTVVSTYVTVPVGIEQGPSRLEVVSNGIPSQPVDVTVASKIVTGHVTLLSWAVPTTYVPITVEIRSPGSTTPLDSQTVLLDSSGNFQMATGLPAGTYDFAVKASHWLRVTLQNQTLSGGGTSGLIYSLKNGDVNGDNAVTLGDFAQLRAAYGTETSGPADLNGDGFVTLGDFAALRANYGFQGDP